MSAPTRARRDFAPGLLVLVGLAGVQLTACTGEAPPDPAPATEDAGGADEAPPRRARRRVPLAKRRDPPAGESGTVEPSTATESNAEEPDRRPPPVDAALSPRLAQLIEKLRAAKDHNTQNRLWNSASRAAKPEDRDALIGLLDDPDTWVRRVGIRALGRFASDDARALEAVLRVLDDDEQERLVRYGAFSAVGEQDLRAAIPILERIVAEHEMDTVRISALNSLSALEADGHEEAVLAGYPKTENLLVRRALIEALARIGTKRCFALLDRVASGESETNDPRKANARAQLRAAAERTKVRIERRLEASAGAAVAGATARATAPWWTPTPEQKAFAEESGWPLAIESSLGMKLALIPPGTFTMGSAPDEPDRGRDERPHEVTLTGAFYMAATETTWAQLDAFLPQGEKSDRVPASATWTDATSFCEWLGSREGDPERYRLPTEAEWEYACRAGTTTARWWGDGIDHGKHANVADRRHAKEMPAEIRATLSFADVDDGYPERAPVRSYPANPWGLFDTIGNLAEWCRDVDGPYPEGPVTDPTGPEEGKRRVIRGGSYSSELSKSRSAGRSAFFPASGATPTGFRVVAVRAPDGVK